MKSAIIKIFYQLLLYSDSRPTFVEKSCYQAKWLGMTFPFAYILNQINNWFQSNHQFVSFVIYVLGANMLIGAYRHFKENTFSWKEFFIKNSEMFFVLIVVYGMLHVIDQIAGDSITGGAFQMIIQLSTLLYPISKAMRNVYFITNKNFPPEFIMTKIYKFNKTGKTDDFFDSENQNSNENEN